MMSRKNLVIDAWMREAQEAVKLLEDIETRVKSKNNIIAVATKSKLLEVGVKLDRLESLLHNPPSKPILTNEDLEHRWKMLSDAKLRTKALVLCLYAMPSLNRTGGLAIADTKEISSRTASSYDHDQIKASPSFGKDEPELLKPLVSDNATQSHMQIRQFGSFTFLRLFRKVCWIVCVILGAAAFLFMLVIVCAII